MDSCSINGSHFTGDKFICGLCNLEILSIDDYFTHMIQVENCILSLESSSYMPDVFLPKFKERNQFDVIKQKIENNKHLGRFASEVEVGDGLKRWKCSICSLTFSCHAALCDHFKLIKHKFPMNFPTPKTVKYEENEERPSLPPTFTDSKATKSENVKNSDHSGPVCYICGQVFKSMAIVASHMKMVHSNTKPFSCNTDGCSLQFKTKGSLLRHLRRHTGDRPYKCLKCNRTFRESGSLSRHRQSKAPCNKASSNVPVRYGRTLPFEPSHKHMIGEESFKKEKFDESFAFTSQSTPEIEETKSKVALDITRRNSSSYALGTSDEFRPLNAKDLRVMKEERISQDDQQVANEDLEKKISMTLIKESVLCRICEKEFEKKSSLSTHMKTHASDLGNECVSCKRVFNNSSSLRKHLVNNCSIKRFECKQCEKEFSLRCYALVHVKSHSTEKTVSCPECGRFFKTVSSRNMHLKIHGGQRNFECGLCFKTFAVKGSLMRHLQVHSRERPYSCQVCGRTFKEKSTLIRHKKLKKSCSVIQDNETLEKMPSKDSKTAENILHIFKPKENIDDSYSDFMSSIEDELDAASISNHSELSFSPDDYFIPDFGVFDSLQAESNVM